MRDLSVLAVLLLGLGWAFYRPWIGLLVLTAFGFMHPQSYGSEWLQDLPAYKLQFAAVVLGVLRTRASSSWQRPAVPDWRLVGLLLMWVGFLVTTTQAKVEWAAWPRFFELSKVFLALALTVLLIDTRVKLMLLVLTIAASIALVTIKGGYWALMSGFSDRVYGPPRSHFYDNNLFAVAVVMNIPLLVLWLRESRSLALRIALGVVIGLSAASALSSWSRGALLALAATAVLLLGFSTRRWLALAVMVGVAVAAWFVLPDSWFDRMGTIAAHGADASAQNRLRAWEVGLRHALAFPVTGVGFDGWHFAMVTMDWHNSYVEMAAEHGLVVFALWCALLFGSILWTWRLGNRSARSSATAWAAPWARMLGVSLSAYAIGGFFLGLAYWDLLYQLIVISALLETMVQRSVAGSRPVGLAAPGSGGHGPSNLTARAAASADGVPVGLTKPRLPATPSAHGDRRA